MIDIKDTSRTLAGKFARKLCDAYPETFFDKLGGKKVEGNDDIWGDGYETLTTQIYNCVKYRENSSSKSRKRKRVPERDSDDEEIEARENEEVIAKKWDEYGCVEYAPDLPSTETSNSQEEKRLLLKEFFENNENDEKEVLKLMNETYSTQRSSINKRNRNLNDVMIDWPFLSNPVHFINHSSRLLGKNVSEIWNESLKAKAKIIRLYLKVPQKIVKGDKKDNKKEKIIAIFHESKQYIDVNKSKLYKILVIFSLLATVFDEKIDCFFKIIKVSY